MRKSLDVVDVSTQPTMQNRRRIDVRCDEACDQAAMKTMQRGRESILDGETSRRQADDPISDGWIQVQLTPHSHLYWY